MRAGDEGGRQAPDLVVVASDTVFADVGIFQLGAVAVEVQGQGLILVDREHVVGVHVLFLQHVFDVGSVERGLELLGELVATAQYVDRLQATAVTAFGAFARFGGEATGVQLQALDLLGGDQGAGVAFRQQARVVVVQHRQGRHLVAVGQHGARQAELDRRASLGQVVGSTAAVALLEEVDATGTATALAAIQAQRVETEGINTNTDGALGETRGEGADGSLAPLRLVFVAVLVIAIHVSVAQQHFQAAVLYKTFGLGLVIGHRLSRAQHPQCDQTNTLVQHVIFLITG
ncbi:hypothetical protein D3C85_585420 [compost metagenome]